MGTRHRAREAALQILYGMDVSDAPVERAIDRYWATLGAGEEPSDFANSLVRGCVAERDAIDDIIRRVSQHWRVERMARVDRNILRLATHELKSASDVPRNVILDEAVELAKRFGDVESPAFVNGILDHIARDLGKT